ncbi:uncharacterized protein LOC124306067 [Neodiprion virginianus]|uniref:uncharacterized protein LOC124306067 n=1 Tax=Neodiprion virginianus TaxID=2961670 RepID=UPI001EE71ACE|nr:uncharacterized protein LOC124306067 [Neodiprion virginianus]
MVPPPKGVNEEIVKEVFNSATGFVRVDAPIFHKNTYFQCSNASTSSAAPTLDTPYPRPVSRSCNVQKLESIIPSEKLFSAKSMITQNPVVQNDPNVPINRLKTSPQIIPSESSDVFRGFPPSEIFNTQSHVQSIKNFYRPSASYAFPALPPGQGFVNFAGQIVAKNSGQIQQSLGTGLVGPAYRPKWFQNPYLVQKNSYPVPKYQNFYLKTVNNQYVKVPAAKVNNFSQASINTSQASYQAMYNNAHDYLRNRSNTVTSGLLEKVQRHRSLQEATIKTMVAKCESSKIDAVPQVFDGGDDLPSVEIRSVDDSSAVNSNQEEKIIQKKTTIGIISKSRNSTGKINSSNICNTSLEPTVASNYLLDTADGKVFTEDYAGADNSAANQDSFEQFAKEVRMRQRAIQEDIYKMDIVHGDFLPEEGIDDKEDASSIKSEILTASEELINSCKKFLDRAKSGESVGQHSSTLTEVPIFPRTRSLSDVREETSVQYQSDSNLWRLLTTKDDSGINAEKIVQASDIPKTLEVSSDQRTPHSPVEIATIKEAESVDSAPLKRLVRKKKLDVLTAKAKSQKAAQKESATVLVELQDDASLSEVGPKSCTRAKSISQADFSARCPKSIASHTLTSPIRPSTTMAELAAYNKQYYDALLSIQKAKAAVANSLAISSVATGPVGFDPYYYNYVQQQHRQIIQRRQQQILIDHHRYPQQKSLSTGPAPWYGPSDWRYPVIGQSRLPHGPQMLHPPSRWPPSVGFMGRDSQISSLPQRQQTNVTQQSKVPVKRRKLEEIVGRLKETESNSATN